MILSDLIDAYNEDRQLATRRLAEYREHLRYYANNQLPHIETPVPITQNIYKAIVDKVLGLKSNNATRIKTYGQQERDFELATLLDDMLAFFTGKHEYKMQIQQAFFDMFCGGLAVFEVRLVPPSNEKNNYNFAFAALPADSVIIDANSRERDGSDAKRITKVHNFDYLDAVAVFGDKVQDVQNAGQTTANFTRRAIVFETWAHEWAHPLTNEPLARPVWNRYFWQDGEVLKFEFAPLCAGRRHPFIVQKYKIDEKFTPYGFFREVKSLQDFINYAENRQINMLRSNVIMYESGVLRDPQGVQSALMRERGSIEVQAGALSGGRFKILDNNPNYQPLNAKIADKISIMTNLSGLSEENLGLATGTRTSGSAVAQRQQAGLVGIAAFLDSCDSLEIGVLHQLIECIQCYFDKPQIYAIADKKRTLRYFSADRAGLKRLAVGEFDLNFTSVVKTPFRDEMLTYLAEIIKGVASIRPDIVGEMLPLFIENADPSIALDLREAFAAADEKAAQITPQQQEQQEIQSAMQMQLLAKTQAETAKLQSQAAVANAAAQQGRTSQTRLKGTDEVIDTRS